MQGTSSRGAAPFVLAAALASAPLGAQQPPPPTASPPVAQYSAPVIVLVQPADGGTVPRDKPIIIMRFASGEPGDAIDTRSFAITVDGIDRAAAFQVTAGEAWGPIADPDTRPADISEVGKTYTIAARVCSQRGACAAMTAAISAVVSPAIAGEDTRSRRDRLIDLLLRAARRLIEP